jgi:hypothetical protein
VAIMVPRIDVGVLELEIRCISVRAIAHHQNNDGCQEKDWQGWRGSVKDPCLLRS